MNDHDNWDLWVTLVGWVEVLDSDWGDFRCGHVTFTSGSCLVQGLANHKPEPC